ncbi:MAG: hypothetical protein L6290_14000 [Thermodesulfovibrionales bacterium]|nr:hypothetical protein [Thermodesulfovibrionales bacterium]
MLIPNEEIRELIVEIPEGHKHLRGTFVLKDGQEMTFLEAAIANLVRAYVTVKTHPSKTRIRLVGQHIDEGKQGFAGWQLLEDKSKS